MILNPQSPFTHLLPLQKLLHYDSKVVVLCYQAPSSFFLLDGGKSRFPHLARFLVDSIHADILDQFSREIALREREGCRRGADLALPLLHIPQKCQLSFMQVHMTEDRHIPLTQRSADEMQSERNMTREEKRKGLTASSK